MLDDRDVLVFLGRQMAVYQTKRGVVRNVCIPKTHNSVVDSRLPVGLTHFPYVVRNAAEETFYQSRPSFRQPLQDRPRKK